MNNIITIRPYKHNQAWVFDDPSKDLDKEALVCGTDQIIDAMCHMAGLPLEEAHKGFTLMFSANPMPNYQVKAERFAGEKNYDERDKIHFGNWYKIVEPSVAAGMEGWLCPALFKYFKEAPETLYAMIYLPKKN